MDKDPFQDEVLEIRSCRCHNLEVLVWKLFSAALGRFLSQDLARPSPAAAGPLMTILWDSPRDPGMKTLVQAPYSSL